MYWSKTNSRCEQQQWSPIFPYLVIFLFTETLLHRCFWTSAFGCGLSFCEFVTSVFFKWLKCQVVFCVLYILACLRYWSIVRNKYYLQNVWFCINYWWHCFTQSLLVCILHIAQFLCSDNCWNSFFLRTLVLQKFFEVWTLLLYHLLFIYNFYSTLVDLWLALTGFADCIKLVYNTTIL